MSGDAGMGEPDEVFLDEIHDLAGFRELLAQLTRNGHISPPDRTLLDRHFSGVRPTRLVVLAALHQALNASGRIN